MQGCGLPALGCSHPEARGWLLVMELLLASFAWLCSAVPSQLFHQLGALGRGQPWQGVKDLAGRVVSCLSTLTCSSGGCELLSHTSGGAVRGWWLCHHHAEPPVNAVPLPVLRPAAFIAGSLVDFLKTSEGVKLSIHKLLDMAAQVSGGRAVGLLVERALPGLVLGLLSC